MHGFAPIALAAAAVVLPSALAAPAPAKRWAYHKYFDLEGHRGSRGHYVESTLPAFSEGLAAGVTSLEFDTGLTKDGHLVVWHDEQIEIASKKCLDTAPAFENDPLFPYVGKQVANLTLAQIKTLDCGSQRIDGFPLQIEVPGTRISTLDEVFDFIDCATQGTKMQVLFNIETKINPVLANQTRSPDDFVAAFAEVLKRRGGDLMDRVTHQSFDWRSLIISKKLMPELRTSALCDDTTIYKYLSEGLTLNSVVSGNLSIHGTGASHWLAGIDIDSFKQGNNTVGERVALAAASIGANVLSPVGTSYASPVADPAMPGYIPFVTKAMVDAAHSKGLIVAPWTINRLNVIEYLINDAGVDGVISDYPRDVRAWAELYKGPREITLAPAPSSGELKKIQKCLAKHNEVGPVGKPAPAVQA